MAGVADVLKSLARVLGRAGIRWYLFGAQAVIFHGRVRQSADVDVTVQLGRLTPSALLERLQKGGFRLLVDDDAAEFIARTRVIPVEHVRSHIPVDIVLAGPGLEEEILDRAKDVNVAGAAVPVVSAEDLILLKLLAGRTKDLEDVRGIIERQGKRLDVNGLRDRVKDVERMLDQSDLSPLLAGLLKERKSPPARRTAKRTRRR